MNMEVDDVKGRTNIELYKNDYGKIVVPSIPHKDRAYGGHLMIVPDKKINHWYQLRKQYGIEESDGYSILKDIAEESMLSLINSKLPDGREGAINILDGGNWQFHKDRDYPSCPAGIEKDGTYKSLHLHMYGRSPLEPCNTWEERMLHWGWGEAPEFPRFRDTPFAPPKKGKEWIVPNQFNEEEIKYFKNSLEELASQIKWPKKPNCFYF